MPTLRSADQPKSILKTEMHSAKATPVGKGKGKEDVKKTADAATASAKPARGTKRVREEKKVEGVKASKRVAKDAGKEASTNQKKKVAIAEDDTDTAVEAVADEDVAKGVKKLEKEGVVAEDDDSDDDNDEDEDGEILHGLSDVSDADSSDEEDESVGEITRSGVVKLPSSRDDAVVKSRLDTVQKKKKESGRSSTPMVLYFGRVPKSMPEGPLRAYLSQFGDISRLRLSRNKNTGASKHYAFVEFEDEEVAQIVQETMNNYLLEGRLLQVRVLPKEKVHPSMWIGADKKWRKVPEVRRFKVLHDEPKTAEEKERIQRKLLKRQDARRQKIQKQGIAYDFEGYVSFTS
ncbi:hypothetical protein CBS101457_000674 [Exobasidium rhododendri]|nr:hypothetical protein CBS101457_000674 [Exobasidium rhododendri]